VVKSRIEAASGEPQAFDLHGERAGNSFVADYVMPYNVNISS
jgi:hypothetical protein